MDDGCIVAAREERLLDIWRRKLQEELLEMEAPVIGTLKGSLDPDRAALLLVGKTRASTLKRYLSCYGQWSSGWQRRSYAILRGDQRTWWTTC